MIGTENDFEVKLCAPWNAKETLDQYELQLETEATGMRFPMPNFRQVENIVQFPAPSGRIVTQLFVLENPTYSSKFIYKVTPQPNFSDFRFIVKFFDSQRNRVLQEEYITWKLHDIILEGITNIDKEILTGYRPLCGPNTLRFYIKSASNSLSEFINTGKPFDVYCPYFNVKFDVQIGLEYAKKPTYDIVEKISSCITIIHPGGNLVMPISIWFLNKKLKVFYQKDIVWNISSLGPTSINQPIGGNFSLASFVPFQPQAKDATIPIMGIPTVSQPIDLTLAPVLVQPSTSQLPYHILQTDNRCAVALPKEVRAFKASYDSRKKIIGITLPVLFNSTSWKQLWKKLKLESQLTFQADLEENLIPITTTVSGHPLPRNSYSSDSNTAPKLRPSLVENLQIGVKEKIVLISRLKLISWDLSKEFCATLPRLIEVNSANLVGSIKSLIDSSFEKRLKKIILWDLGEVGRKASINAVLQGVALSKDDIEMELNNVFVCLPLRQDLEAIEGCTYRFQVEPAANSPGWKVWEWGNLLENEEVAGEFLQERLRQLLASNCGLSVEFNEENGYIKVKRFVAYILSKSAMRDHGNKYLIRYQPAMAAPTTTTASTLSIDYQALSGKKNKCKDGKDKPPASQKRRRKSASTTNIQQVGSEKGKVKEEKDTDEDKTDDEIYID